MLNKNELEKIEITSEEKLSTFRECDLTHKYIVLNVTSELAKFGNLEECIIEGGSVVCKKLSRCMVCDAEYIHADEIYFSELKKCKRVQCGSVDYNYTIKASRFCGCGEIVIDEAIVEECVFDNFETLYPTLVQMDGCVIRNIVCEEDCAISMEDGELTNILFENITLKNGSYLIEGYGNPWVESSTFVNVRTSRMNREIFHMEETKGMIFKKTVEYSFVDEETCCGIEQVQSTD